MKGNRTKIEREGCTSPRSEDLYRISPYVENMDMILGVKWLHILGDVTINWSDMIMRIGKGKQQQIIQGDPNLNKSIVSIQHCGKLLNEIRFIGCRQL